MVVGYSNNEGLHMGTYRPQTAASSESSKVAAVALDTLHEQWWEMLDGPERRAARSFHLCGIPNPSADKLAAAGLPQVRGSDGRWLPRMSLTAFIARHPGSS